MKKVWLALVIFFMCSVTTAQIESNYPHKTIKIIVPYPAGGVTDVATRIVASKMSDRLGQSIVVENQPSAGGVTATNAVAKSSPDGYTLMAAFDSFATNPFMYKSSKHNPLKDFAPISLMLKSPQVLVVYPGTRIKNMEDLLQKAREEKDTFTFATPGAGTSSRLSTELFKQMTGLESTIISYKGGAQAITDLIGGQVDAMIVSVSLVLPFIQAGKLTPIAVSSLNLVSQLPGVPPLSDKLPGFEAQSWVGMVAPAGTPKTIINILNFNLNAILNSNEFRDKYNSQGVEVLGTTPEAFAEWIRQESIKWSDVIKQKKISID
jgi:tripartite-type tricarboxylate transporter receptor subunit TctC